MIIVDLDGTILNSNRKVSDKTKEYLNFLKNKGYIITIATGRIYASALNATDGADFANYIISDTGSCAYNTLNGNPIFENTINHEIAQKIFNYYDDNCRFIDICDKYMYYKYSNEVESNEVVGGTKDKEYILKKCKEISHISISLKSNEAVISLYNRVLNEIPEVDPIVMQDSFSDRMWIDILPKGCSKYNGIKKLIELLNVSNDEIMSFGDGLNDIEMLEKCGFGVALKNALPEVKKVADAVTSYDYNNDGVVMYLMENLYDE